MRQLHVACTAFVPKQLSCIAVCKAGILQPPALHLKTCKVGTLRNAMSGVVDARVSCAGALQDLQTEWQQ